VLRDGVSSRKYDNGTRKAEIFGYSFANYEDHLGLGNVRYERLMPEMVRKIERPIQENWPRSRLAKELDLSVAEAEGFVEDFERARQVVDAENPGESFRNAVRFSIQDAVEKGLATPGSIEALVTQICFRAADLAFLLKMRGESLSRYSRHLRREPDVEYYEGYFDEPECFTPTIHR
jgi:hypothetical protein